MPREDNPDYVILFRATKAGKQANIEQMNAMIRSSGEKPVESATFLEGLLKMQTWMLEKIGTTPTLRAMRLVETEIVARYSEDTKKSTAS